MEDIDKQRVFVHGSATIDAVIQGHFSVEYSRVGVTTATATHTFEVIDGPIVEGEKHRLAEPNGEDVHGLKHDKRLGGGGINSAIALRTFDKKIGILYTGFSSPHPLLERGLSRRSIEYHFLEHYPVPVNAILGGREDKLILMSPLLGSTSLREQDRGTIDDAMRLSDVFLLNSPKDPNLVEHVIENSSASNTPVYVVVTKLDPDFVFKYVMPRATIVISYEDMVALSGSDPRKLSKQENMRQSLEMLRQLRTYRKTDYQRIYLTIGKQGARLLNNGVISHVRLDDHHLGQVQQSISMERGGTTGAGDVFAAAVAHYENIRKPFDIIEIVKKACERAVRHIGYAGPIYPNAFLVRID